MPVFLTATLLDAMFLGNPAWTAFLISALGFGAFDLGVLSLSGAVFSYLALLVYKTFLAHTNWRLVYVVTTLISCTFTTMQLALIVSAESETHHSHLQRLSVMIRRGFLTHLM